MPARAPNHNPYWSLPGGSIGYRQCLRPPHFVNLISVTTQWPLPIRSCSGGTRPTGTEKAAIHDGASPEQMNASIPDATDVRGMSILRHSF